MLLESFPRGVAPAFAGASSSNGGFPEAAWCDPARLSAHPKWRYAAGSVLVGRIGEAVLGVQDDRHMMSVAGSRAGKGRSVIVPNMCLYPGSVIAIDPKGDLATITAARRGKGSRHVEGMGQRSSCSTRSRRRAGRRQSIARRSTRFRRSSRKGCMGATMRRCWPMR